MSSPVHILFDVDSIQQLAGYMEYTGSNLAREINRLTGWKGPVFEGRYTMIPVNNEEAAQLEVVFIDTPSFPDLGASHLLGHLVLGHRFRREVQGSSRSSRNRKAGTRCEFHAD